MRPDVLADHLATTIRGLHAPLALSVAALEGVVEGVHARLARLEAQARIPGPAGDPGEPGPPGPPGRDGVDGKSLNYLGVYVAGKTYDAGDLATDDGSVFYCARTTQAAPGTSKDWQLMVKRGRDARGSR